MKVIDLLNKIANNELPNKTRFKVFSSNDEKQPFICKFDNSYPGTLWCGDGECKFNFKIDFMRMLNYEVGLIEEKEESNKIEELEIVTIGSGYKDREKMLDEDTSTMVNMLIKRQEEHFNKINEIVREINKIKESER